jgi:hypothetical protein
VRRFFAVVNSVRIPQRAYWMHNSDELTLPGFTVEAKKFFE